MHCNSHWRGSKGDWLKAWLCCLLQWPGLQHDTMWPALPTPEIGKRTMYTYGLGNPLWQVSNSARTQWLYTYTWSSVPGVCTWSCLSLTPTKWGRVFASRKGTSPCQTTCRNFFPNEESFICLYCIFIYLLLIVYVLILADLLHRKSVSTKKDCTCEMESILHYHPSYSANGRMIGV